MTKKKPDFLRDLDTAIMDELTGGGIKGNAAGLVGTLTQIKEIKQLCGLPFCGYMAKLETVWEFSDIWNGLMALPNIIALIFLMREVTVPGKTEKRAQKGSRL